jgi:hypothetical protein
MRRGWQPVTAERHASRALAQACFAGEGVRASYVAADVTFGREGDLRPDYRVHVADYAERGREGMSTPVGFADGPGIEWSRVPVGLPTDTKALSTRARRERGSFASSSTYTRIQKPAWTNEPGLARSLEASAPIPMDGRTGRKGRSGCWSRRRERGSRRTKLKKKLGVKPKVETLSGSRHLRRTARLRVGPV